MEDNKELYSRIEDFVCFKNGCEEKFTWIKNLNSKEIGQVPPGWSLVQVNLEEDLVDIYKLLLCPKHSKEFWGSLKEDSYLVGLDRDGLQEN